MKKYFKWCRSHSFWLIVSHSNETKALMILWGFLHWSTFELDLTEESEGTNIVYQTITGTKSGNTYLCLANYLADPYWSSLLQPQLPQDPYWYWLKPSALHLYGYQCESLRGSLSVKKYQFNTTSDQKRWRSISNVTTCIYSDWLCHTIIKQKVSFIWRPMNLTKKLLK